MLETEREIPVFSAQTLESLNVEGYKTYKLAGESIKSLRYEGLSFWTVWHKKDPAFEKMQSRTSWVAINPSPQTLFVPHSNKSTQQQLIERFNEYFSKEISPKIPGVKGIRGSAPDWIEIIFQHYNKTGQWICGAEFREYGMDYIRTSTVYNGASIRVGHYDYITGLGVRPSGVDDRAIHLWAAVMLVPATAEDTDAL